MRRKIGQNMSEKESCLSSSNRFKIKVIIVWLIICVPGNIFAIICIYTNKSNDTFISEQNYTNSSWIRNPIKYLNLSRYSEENKTTIQNFKIQATTDVKNGSEVIPQHLNATNDSKTLTNDNEGDIQCYESFEKVLENARNRIRYWIEGVGVFVVGTIGFPCNVVTALVLRKYRVHRKNRNFHILIMFLTIADTILIIDIVWQKSIFKHLMKPPKWYNQTYAYIWHPLRGMALSGTIFMIIAVSTERFRSVCCPMEHQISPFKYVATVVSAAIFSKLHRFLQFKLNEDKNNYRLGNLMKTPTYIRFNAYWEEIAVTGVIPLFILIYLNLKIYLKIRSSKKMDSVRHRGRSRLSTKSFDLSPTSLNFATSAFDHENTVELSNIEKAVDKRFRNSKRVKYNQNPLDSKQTCRTCIATSFKSNRSLSDSEVDNSETKRNSILVKHDSSNATYVRKKMIISGKKKRNIGEKILLNQKKISANTENQLIGKENKQLSSLTIMSEKQPKTNCLEHTNVSSKKSTVSDTSLDNVANHLAKNSDETREKLFSMEKSTLILIIIVSLFIVTHSTRMASKLYMTIFPQLNTEENFIRCFQLNRYHVPFALYVLSHLNSILIVLSSSLNFIIYCCVAKGFREHAITLFRKNRRRSRRQRNRSSLYA